MRLFEIRKVMWEASQDGFMKIRDFQNTWMSYHEESITKDEAIEHIKTARHSVLVGKDLYRLDWQELVRVGSRWEAVDGSLWQVTERLGALATLRALDGHIEEQTRPWYEVVTQMDPRVKNAWDMILSN